MVYLQKSRERERERERECEKCGALLSRMHNFCPRCGTKVSGESEPLKKKKEKKKKEVRKRT